MVDQSAVDAHAGRVAALVRAFAEHVALEVEDVIAQTVSYIIDNLQLEEGRVRQVPQNSSLILGIEQMFQSALSKSAFFPVVMAFVSGFVDQVDEFSAMHDGPMLLTSEDHEVLGNQAAAAIGAIEGQVYRIVTDLRNLLARSLGEVGLSELVTGVSDVIRKLNRVEPIAKDQLLLFFRTVGSLVYRSVDHAGERKYAYVGPVDDDVRDFCLLLAGKQYSMAEIDSMDNGQVPGVFHTGGGYGCRHWWAMA